MHSRFSSARQTVLSCRSASAICFALLSVGVHAADFSDNSIGFGYGSRFSNPGTNDGDVHRSILNFTHFSGDSLGTNFFDVDVLRSGANEPSAGGGGGAQEVYGIYSRNWSYSKISGNKLNLSLVRDFSLTTRFDFSSKNDAFAARSRKLTLGPTLSFDVPGFLEVGIYAYRESNHNGIVGKDVTFRTAPKISTAWQIPLGSAFDFRGFIDVVGPKGRDGFGVKTKTEILSQMKLMADSGSLMSGKRNGLLLGIGLEYWHNKFGSDPAKNPVGTTKELTPLLLAEYHF